MSEQSTSITESLMSNLSLQGRIAMISLLMILIGFSVWSVFNYVENKHIILTDRIEYLKTALEEIKKGEPAYLKYREKQNTYEDRLNANKLDLSKLMEGIARDQGFSIEDFREKRYVFDSLSSKKNRKKGKKEKVLVSYTQKINIQKISLKQLSSFLEKLEQERAPVRVTEIDIKPSQGDRQELRFVKLSVATYKKEKDR